jgi:hypothetical protein
MAINSKMRNKARRRNHQGRRDFNIFNMKNGWKKLAASSNSNYPFLRPNSRLQQNLKYT